MRILILGGPRCGKTTLSAKIALQQGIHFDDVAHTDDLIGSGAWSDVSAKIADLWIPEPGPWLIEGVAVARALRKWLSAHPEGKPADTIYHLHEPRTVLTSHQEGMRKGCLVVFEEIQPELRRRGVALVHA